MKFFVDLTLALGYESSMAKDSYRLLDDPTLSPRHFSELKLLPQQLHMWMEVTGIGKSAREAGSWRKFSPAAVLQLATIKELKARTGLNLGAQKYVLDVIERSAAVSDCVTYWAKGENSYLVSDLLKDNWIGHESAVNLAIKTGTKFWCVLSLEDPIKLMLRAMVRGGTEAQKGFAKRCISENRVAVSRQKIKGQRILAVEPDIPLIVDDDEALEYVHVTIG